MSDWVDTAKTKKIIDTVKVTDPLENKELG